VNNNNKGVTVTVICIFMIITTMQLNSGVGGDFILSYRVILGYFVHLLHKLFLFRVWDWAISLALPSLLL